MKSLYLCAFDKGENEIVSKLAIVLLSKQMTPETISLVYETDGAIVGHIAFSPVVTDNNPTFQGYILAPLAVKPDYQKRRIGSKLIEHGTQQLSDMGINVLFVYGDPRYYARFGFSADAAHQYSAPYELQYPFGWQAIVLKECHIENPPLAISCVAPLCDPKLW